MEKDNWEGSKLGKLIGQILEFVCMTKVAYYKKARRSYLMTKVEHINERGA